MKFRFEAGAGVSLGVGVEAMACPAGVLELERMVDDKDEAGGGCGGGAPDISAMMPSCSLQSAGFA